ncbi:MAG: hypothetical protein U0903_10330 [Planctomycetales bacterium]
MAVRSLLAMVQRRLVRWSAKLQPGKRNGRRLGALLRGVAEGLESRQLLTVTYHGGELLENVKVQGIYLGPNWSTDSLLQSQAAQFEQFLPTIVSGGYMDMLTNAGYKVGRGSAAPGVFDSLDLGSDQLVHDSEIREEIQTLITAGTVQAPDENQLYVVFVQQGVLVEKAGGTSANIFLAYHGGYAGTTPAGKKADIHYAVIVYPGGPNFTSQSQGFASDFDQMTSVTSHEIAESATDPNVNYKKRGWYDDRQRLEIADLARSQTDFQGYRVYNVVDQQGNVLDPNGQSPGDDAPSAATAPQNVTAQKLSETSAQITWDQVASATEYRVYVRVGAKVKLAGKLKGFDQNSFTLSGSNSKKGTEVLVEAVNEMSFDDSKWTTILPMSLV